MMPDELKQPKSSTATTRLLRNRIHHLPNLILRSRKWNDRMTAWQGTDKEWFAKKV